jgi:major membrane immunogen (membrane-anchored lipoprotein)
MKKAILLLIATLFLTACSSDDDGGSSNLLIGTWRFTETVNYYATGTIITRTPYECRDNSKSTFNEDGTYSQTIFYEDTNNNCIQRINLAYINWEMINDSILRIKSDRGMRGISDIDYTIVENTANRLILNRDFGNFAYDEIFEK